MRRLLMSLAICATLASAQEKYQKPPQQILDVLNAPVTPSLSMNPTRDHALLIEPVAYLGIADLAQPVVRIAGLRINPANNGPHAANYGVALSLLKLSDGAVTKV